MRTPSKALPHVIKYIKEHPNRYQARKLGRFLHKLNYGFNQINKLEDKTFREEMRQIFYQKYRKQKKEYDSFFTTELAKQDFNNVFMYYYRQHLRSCRMMDEIVESIEGLEFLDNAADEFDKNSFDDETRPLKDHIGKPLSNFDKLP